MSKDSVIAKAQALEGKKARLKPCDEAPSGTKVKKLPKDVIDGLEEHFNVKLNKVRVHTGGNIAEIGRKLKAKAFTIDQNIYLVKSGDVKNSELLAHELTHVIQQSGGKLKKKTKPGKALIGN